MRTKRIIVLMALSALCVTTAATQALAADSSSSTSKGDPVTVMALGDFTNPTAGINTPELEGAVRAVAKRVNKSGGLTDASGVTHKLVVIGCDGKLDPNTVADCAREAVSKKVAAVLGYGGSLADNILPILSAAGVPLIGALPNAVSVLTSPVSFPLVSGGTGAIPGIPFVLQAAGAETQTFTQMDLGGAQFLGLLANVGGKNAGVDFKQTTPVPPDQADMSSAAAAATAGNPEGVGFFMVGDGPANFVRAVRQSGYDGPMAFVSEDVPGVISQLGKDANGLLITGNTRYLKTTKGGRMFAADMKAYDKNLTLSDLSAIYWQAADTFVRVAETMPTIDTASTLTAMGQLHDFDMLGMTPPLTTDVPYAGNTPFPFPRLFNPTVFYYTVKNGKIAEYEKTFTDPFLPAT